jgi:hypothetical protein
LPLTRVPSKSKTHIQHVFYTFLFLCLQDRIHLKTTHFQYARHLESLGLIDEAIEHYQLSVTANTEVPRMLFQLG